MDYIGLPKRNIIAIDMKSFYATCECIDRKLDPYTTPLVVAEPNRNGAMTLAVTPYMKSLGIKGRTRIYEIPSNIKFITAPPRMDYYIKMSKEVVSIYQEYVDIKDIHIYSIDECFLDVTDYLRLYKKTDYELALEIMNKIKRKTGLISTCGIGPNLLIAKVAMDIEAKHTKDNIAKWTYEDIESKFWPITPLSKFWGIGARMEKNLNDMGLYKIGDIAVYDKAKLKKKFGIIGEELYEHANGIDYSRISDFNRRPKEQSYGHSQVLYKDYNEDNIKLIIREMIDVLTARLRRHNKKATIIGFGLSYSKTYGGGFYHSKKIGRPTNDGKYIYEIILSMLERFCEDYPIRKVSINLAGLVDNNIEQLNLFENYEKVEEKENINKAIDDIKDKYGKNSILKASSLLKDSTAKERNKKIGGHRA